MSHRGRVRQLNEDSIVAQPPVFMVADGVGGAEAGEVASAIAAGELALLADSPILDSDRVVSALERAHEGVLRLQRTSPGAATTCVGGVELQIGGMNYWLIFNIGDSRAYRLVGRPGLRRLVQVSVDHSQVQELIDAGVLTAEQAADHPERNVVTRALGARTGCHPDFWLIPMVVGDRYLFCSDGLTNEVDVATMRTILAGRTPDEAANELLEAALRAGARDNISVIVVDVLAAVADDATVPSVEHSWH